VEAAGRIVGERGGDRLGAAGAAIGPHRGDEAVLGIVGVGVVVEVAAAVGDVRRGRQFAVGAARRKSRRQFSALSPQCYLTGFCL
jgi:hypothetical protein